MSLRSLLSAARRQTICSLHARRIPWGNRGPIVSFTFDDFPRSAYITGGAILKSLDARGTYYTAPGLMNTTNHLGEQFHAEDVQSLLKDGHELASHTFSHISCRKVSNSVYGDDVDHGRRAILELAGTADSGNFAYPYGDVTLKSKRTLGPKLCSSRSIFPGLNGPDVDLNLLLGNSLYGGLDGSPKAKKLIDENKRQRNWLIFYTHDVQATPSIYGCTPSLLESTAAFAIEQGCRILPVRAVLAELGVCCPRSVPSASS